jgi:hypothetical protein
LDLVETQALTESSRLRRSRRCVVLREHAPHWTDVNYAEWSLHLSIIIY